MRMVDGVITRVQALLRTPARPPMAVMIDPEHADRPLPGGRLDPRRDYFEVRVNRLHLGYEREWFSRFVPVVFVASEFSHDGAHTAVPALVGPGLIEHLGGATPVGSVIADSRVAGPHPVPPGGVAVSVVLYRVEKEQVAQALFDVVEGAAGALDLTAGTLPYTALAKVVVNGVTALVGGDQPMLARRDHFDPVTPGYYALIDDTDGIDPADLHIRDGDLALGAGGRIEPYRASDYVLYSISRVRPQDVDLTRLPLNQTWQDVVRQATTATSKDLWRGTKATMSTLVGQLYASPDLTWEHAEALEHAWTEDMLALRDRALRRAHLADDRRPPDLARHRALSVLDL
ncbi:hypothetical protein [Streptomyces sp. NPDC057302]|uniref:hypothetical protein n=1 Tax=Streptomyces sp. NPDC057302 TaxID=3346094 RepID=UPI00362C5E3C